MDQKWIHVLVILVLYQQIPSGAGEHKIVKEGQTNFEIKCEVESRGSAIYWFRVLDTSGVELIGSFSSNGKVTKYAPDNFNSIFSATKMSQHILILKSFERARDSGAYSCAFLKGSALIFGKVTRLVGEKVVVAPLATTVAAAAATKQNLCTTAPACICDSTNKKEETSPSMFCPPIILGPLAGGCGLLLLLLIITIVYCNKIRTRRCPHHYKRQPRTMPAGKQMNNRHI